MTWTTFFDESYPNPPLSTDELNVEVSKVSAPFTEAEKESIASALSTSLSRITVGPNPLTTRPFPTSFLDFLGHCDGGDFRQGEREFLPFLKLSEIREHQLGRGCPASMPDAVPFAMDAGCLYLFDMRKDPVEGEYPIVFCGMQELEWSEATPVANTFLELLTGVEHPDEMVSVA